MNYKDSPLRFFSGKHILVVEDEYLLAQRLASELIACGALVVGPAGHVEGGLAFVAERHIDAAILDISLHGETVFAVADRLESRAIPFAFVSAYNSGDIPVRYRKHPLCAKPVELHHIAAALFG